FDDEKAAIIREILYSVYARYSNEEIWTANTDDSSRNYFRKHHNEKSKNNTHGVLEEYLTAIEKNCNSLDFWKTRSADTHYSGLAQMA
ncbi:12576_t:CDS:1, partial [Gigaspora margarita]